MFAIYNNGTVQFRSTSDNLYSLKKVDNLEKTRLQTSEGTITDFSGDKNNGAAINTYRKMAKIEKQDNLYHVEDIMSEDCLCIEKNKTLDEAYTFLKDNKINQVPVITENRQLDSMINKKFILNMIMADINNASYIVDKKIGEFLLPEVITTDPISDIRRVAKVMIDFKLDAMPVVSQSGTLKGIVSKTDILKAISQITNFRIWT